MDKLTLFRSAFKAQSLDGFLVPMADEYQNEYVPDHARRIEWLTGFTGSAGFAVVLQDRAAFFTDGRYTLQAAEEVKGFELHNSNDTTPEAWLAENAKGLVVGYDPWLHTKHALKRLQKKVTLKAAAKNPIDDLWQDRPETSSAKAFVHEEKYAGESHAGKRARMAEQIRKEGADVAVIAAPDSINWLLNIRGRDVETSPVVMCFAALEASGKTTLFIDEAKVTPEVRAHLGKDVTIKSQGALASDMAALKGKRVWLDTRESAAWFAEALNGATIIEKEDPCILGKACKSAVELEGMRAAHVRDGAAVVKFLHWLSTQKKVGELQIAEQMLAFRKEAPEFFSPSFFTIAGSGPHGAIVHYRASEQSNRTLQVGELLLLDSGGQYPDGTTDITRTIAFGKPSAEMRENFTRVLKGHIAIATAQFPQGTVGAQLDGMARQFLWEAGLDYDHGTGHGVGHFLHVHEGPQRISKRGDAALKAGMIISNEPGYYKAGEYGIRIESLVAVVPANGKFLQFETITRVPIDLNLVDTAMLTEKERTWLNAYHAMVLADLTPHLTGVVHSWLVKACQPI